MEPGLTLDNLREYQSLISYIINKDEESVCVVYAVRLKTVCPYDELDDLAASTAISELSSISAEPRGREPS